MNIAFDSFAILGPMSRNRGIGNYALSQFVHMINADNKNQYFFLNTNDQDFHLLDYVANKQNLYEEYIYTGRNEFLLRQNEYEELYGEIVKSFIRRNNIDVFYITSPFESAYHQYQRDWFEGIRVIKTVYDIIPYVMKDRYLSDVNTFTWYKKCIDNLCWSDKLLVISDSVKNDLIRHFHFPPSQIETIWGAPSLIFKQLDIKPYEKKKFLAKYGIKTDFIMCTGGDDWRKNIDGLIRSYSLLPKALKDKYQLVVVCKLSTSGLDNLQTIARECHVEKNVIFTNFVTDETLVKFCNLATLMAFPSKYEGFGLPITEAWACGTPVLTANNSSLIEIAGDAAILVDADNDYSIAKGLEQILSDDEILQNYTVRGQKQLQKYQWPKVAAKAIEIISQLSETNKQEDASKNKQKIAMFTPLPPIQSGISDYSYDLISELSKFVDIDVFIDSDYKTDVKLPENVHIYQHEKYLLYHKQYHRTLYQLGNSEYHFYMYDYIQKFPDLLVLHDYNMHSAFYCFSIDKRKDYDLYEKIVSKDFVDSNEYVNTIRMGIGPDIFGRELNNYLLNESRQVIVHSEYVRQKLLRKNISYNVNVIAHYAQLPKKVDKNTSKAKLSLPNEDIIISAFGIIHPTKRIFQIVHAFVKLKNQFNNLKLVLAGKLLFEDGDQKKFNQLIADYNLQNNIVITGYLSLDQWLQYLEASDICLNLRYPYNGETSGSLMRILAYGKPVVVNNIGTFSELPDDICIKLPSAEFMNEKEEISEIYDALEELIADKELRKKLSTNAREYAKKNLDIEIVAQKYLDSINQKQGKLAITENLIQHIKLESQFGQEDIDEIARTLAYVKTYIR